MDTATSSIKGGAVMISVGGIIPRILFSIMEVWKTGTESPIEGILCTALYRHLGYRRGIGVFDRSVIPNLRQASGGAAAGWVFTQHQIGRYRCDLLIVAVPADGPAEVLVVECDGQNFHSSADQIAYDRDRAIEIRRAGYQMVRFTRSEIYRMTDWVLHEIVRHLGSGGANICEETGKFPGYDGLGFTRNCPSSGKFPGPNRELVAQEEEEPEASAQTCRLTPTMRCAGSWRTIPRTTTPSGNALRWSGSSRDDKLL
jgi:very-short-patch-repair endonuclease